MQDHYKKFQVVLVKESFVNIHSAQFLRRYFSGNFETDILTCVILLDLKIRSAELQ